MVNLDGLVSSVGFINFSLLFGGVLDLGGLHLKHGDGFIESLNSSSEVSILSLDNLLTGFEKRLFLGSKSLFKDFHISVHLITNAGAVVGDHVESLESILDFSGHAFNYLDNFLVHLTLIVVSGEVFPGSAKVNRSLFHRVYLLF